MRKQIRYLPIQQFLLVSARGHRGPDPVPKFLFAMAVLFVFSALLAF